MCSHKPMALAVLLWIHNESSNCSPGWSREGYKDEGMPAAAGTLAPPDGGFGGVGFFGAAALAPFGPGPLCPGGALYPGGRIVFFLRRGA